MGEFEHKHNLLILTSSNSCLHFSKVGEVWMPNVCEECECAQSGNVICRETMCQDPPCQIVSYFLKYLLEWIFIKTNGTDKNTKLDLRLQNVWFFFLLYLVFKPLLVGYIALTDGVLVVPINL